MDPHIDAPPHVIVAGCRHGGLAVIRALGPLGFRITALAHDPQAFAGASRHVDEVSVGPDPRDHDALARHLLDRADRWRGALVLDTEDPYTEALARRSEVLGDEYHLAVPPWSIAGWFLEKDRTTELARRLGVPHPRARPVSTPEDLEAALEEMHFPVLVKPVRSREFGVAFSTKLWQVDDAASARAAITRAGAQGIEVIVQELIPGDDEGTLESIELHINRDGSLGAHQCNVKLRQAPPRFGVMRAGRSVPVIDDVRDQALTLLRGVDYRGFASAEFKRDPRDGLPKLIEVNPRLPRNCALMTRSGTNFPLAIYDDVVRGVPSRPQPLEPSWFIDGIADIGNTLGRDRRVFRHPRSLLEPYLARRKTFAVMSASDPRPALAYLGVRARKMLPGRANPPRRSGHRRQP